MSFLKVSATPCRPPACSRDINPIRGAGSHARSTRHGRGSREYLQFSPIGPVFLYKINWLLPAAAWPLANHRIFSKTASGWSAVHGAVPRGRHKEGAFNDICPVGCESDRSFIDLMQWEERAMRYCREHFSFERRGALLTRGGRLVAASRKVLDLFSHLIEQRHRVVSCDELIQATWGHTATSDNRLSQILVCTRRTIGDDGHAHRLIRTLASIGYRWVGPVDASTESATRREEKNHIAAKCRASVLGFGSGHRVRDLSRFRPGVYAVLTRCRRQRNR